MPERDFSEIVAHYPEVIKGMAYVFTSHEFILALAHRYQKLYVEALYTCRNSTHRGRYAPFMVVRRLLSEKLNEFSGLVTRDSDNRHSVDIFGEKRKCPRWRRQGQTLFTPRARGRCSSAACWAATRRGAPR